MKEKKSMFSLTFSLSEATDWICRKLESKVQREETLPIAKNNCNTIVKEKMGQVKYLAISSCISYV